MATYKTTIDRMKNTREIANRLNLGACPQCDYLRAVLVEFMSDLIGDDVRHPSLELSGAQFPAPTTAYAPALAPQAAPPARAQQPPRAAVGQVPNQNYALTIEEAKRLADERAKASTTKPSTAPLSSSVSIGRIVPIQRTAAELAAEHPAAALQAAPDPTVPDPAGQSFLDNLAADLDGEAEDLGAG